MLIPYKMIQYYLVKIFNKIYDKYDEMYLTRLLIDNKIKNDYPYNDKIIRLMQTRFKEMVNKLIQKNTISNSDKMLNYYEIIQKYPNIDILEFNRLCYLNNLSLIVDFDLTQKYHNNNEILQIYKTEIKTFNEDLNCVWK
ncbi:hypothetical protein GE118_03235 [Mycoplasma sp. NEAQ87857]|uniref:hypothetical protein n=1 Tax=Mycoplasma sp. NEAQ87857 TaxID=2683967 RepID=UPI0013174ABC|nr:hypothetical protein [Mycoplasma sp. NEAQ87857]QGZ97803.1 hypothetical protein GE118_03235 [Mycoplasma sp. NEAQ87857]